MDVAAQLNEVLAGRYRLEREIGSGGTTNRGFYGITNWTEELVRRTGRRASSATSR